MSNENGKNTNNIVSNVRDFFAGGIFANGLAVILIVGSIVAITWIIAIHQITILENKNLYKDVLNRNISDTTAAAREFDFFQDYYQETNAANTAILSILLPVFGAWVGAIIAFYYGNKNFEKLSAQNDKMIERYSDSLEESSFGSKRIEEVLNSNSKYKEVREAKMSAQLGISLKNIGSTILLKDDATDKPLGFIYEEDILASTNFKADELKDKLDKFIDFFKANKIKDTITDKNWTENGLENQTKNYAEINLSDTLLQARTKMKDIDTSQRVRGLVFDTQKQIVGIITYDLFSIEMASPSQA